MYFLLSKVHQIKQEQKLISSVSNNQNNSIQTKQISHPNPKIKKRINNKTLTRYTLIDNYVPLTLQIEGVIVSSLTRV
jgi:hypothetical protein